MRRSMDPATVGAVISKDAAKLFQRRAIDATEYDAYLLHGNHREGALFPPTVADCFPNECELLR